MSVNRGSVGVCFFAIAISLLVFPVAGSGQLRSRISSHIDNSQTVALNDDILPVVARGVAIDQGTALRGELLPAMSLHFSMTAAQQADLAQLLKAQQDRNSPEYHKFLTPEQYGDRFGLGSADVEKVTRWLENSGFRGIQVARSRTWIRFSGTAEQAESAFQTSIRQYSLRGEMRWANATEPRVPRALAGVVESVRGLHNIALRPNIIHTKPDFTSSISGSHFLAPSDWATIYDAQPLYSAGLDGTGISIAIVGQSDVNLSVIQNFRAAAGLSASAPSVIVPPGYQDPGFRSADEMESYLDLEWAGGIAKNANILFVTASATSGNGVEDAMTYAIDNNIAPIVSESYSLCEPEASANDVAAEDSLFQQANAQGMTIIVSSGDAGATACDQGVTESSATRGLAVNFPASSPYVTAIGGTEFSDGSGNYWNATNNSGGGSATSYIPEVVWNDAFQLASGGGASILETIKPSWQSGAGVPNDGVRDVPDLSFAASGNHDGYLICVDGGCTNGFRDAANGLDVAGGTSASAPTFAGLLALVIQQHGNGTRLGNINPNLYSLAQISPNAFHDITTGSNQQSCAGGSTGCPAAGGYLGYSAGNGYDLASGLGSVDGYNFAQQWYGDFQIAATPATLTIQPGASATATLSVTPQNNFAGNVTFSCSVSSNLIGVTCSVPSTPVGPSGSAVVTISASNLARVLPRSNHNVRRLPMLLLAGLLLCLLLPAVTRSQSAYRIRPLYAGSAAWLLVIAFGAVSCGGGGSTSVTCGGGTTTTPTPTPALTISCTEPTTATVGVAYSGGCTASGGTAPYSYSSTSGLLPNGLGLNSTSGTITGTPTQFGTYTFTVTVTDSSSPLKMAVSAQQTVVVSSAPASPLTISCSVPPATSGAVYNGPCSASGGTPNYNFAISSGTLPVGLTFNVSEIEGAPASAGTSSFAVQVTDSGPRIGLPQQTATFVVSNFVVLPGPLTVSCSNPSAEVSFFFANGCSAAAGTMPYAWSIISGTLPPGLVLNSSTGSITGVPTAAGAYDLTLKVVDSGSPAQTLTRAINIVVRAYQPLACGAGPSATSAQLNVYFSSVFCLAFGGTVPYTFSLSGNPPPGLTIYQGFGIVQGTPTQAGTYSFNVVLTDSATPPATITHPVTNFVVGPHGAETGTVTITATSGGIVNTTTIAINVP